MPSSSFSHGCMYQRLKDVQLRIYKKSYDVVNHVLQGTQSEIANAADILWYSAQCYTKLIIDLGENFFQIFFTCLLFDLIFKKHCGEMPFKYFFIMFVYSAGAGAAASRLFQVVVLFRCLSFLVQNFVKNQ